MFPELSSGETAGSTAWVSFVVLTVKGPATGAALSDLGAPLGIAFEETRVRRSARPFTSRSARVAEELRMTPIAIKANAINAEVRYSILTEYLIFKPLPLLIRPHDEGGSQQQLLRKAFVAG
jgi:hypothetical protein